MDEMTGLWIALQRMNQRLSYVEDQTSRLSIVTFLVMILVIIFVVLLAVLVVLLTRKEKPIEEVETSYY